MAVKKEDLEIESAAARFRPIEFLTENGFSIVRAEEIGEVRPAPIGTHLFVVRDQKGNERQVTVTIEVAAINEIILASRRHLSIESSYWIVCAERHLADYVWENDDYPPNSTLRVERLTPRDLNLARRWDK